MFESQYTTFPPGIMSKMRFSYEYTAASGPAYEWVYFLHFLLPYLEMQPYYDALDGPHFTIQNPWYDPNPWLAAHEAAHGAAIPAILCPSDGRGGSVCDGAVCPAVHLAKTNYLGIFSGLNDSTAFSDTDQSRAAVFGYSIGRSINDITDGTSNTMAVAEYLTGASSADLRGWFYTNRAVCQTLFVTLGPNSPAPDVTMFCENAAYGSIPNDRVANLPCVRGTTSTDYASPRSRHPGGVNVLLSDGSVQFIQDEIDMEIWRNLGWMSDGHTTNINL